MKRITQIHGRKKPIRRHFLAEWLEARNMEPMDLVNALNESGQYEYLDKTQVYRWLRGTLPQPENQRRIEAELRIEENALLRHPDQDWLAEFFAGRQKEETERIKQAMELAWPKKRA